MEYERKTRRITRYVPEDYEDDYEEDDYYEPRSRRLPVSRRDYLDTEPRSRYLPAPRRDYSIEPSYEPVSRREYYPDTEEIYIPRHAVAQRRIEALRRNKSWIESIAVGIVALMLIIFIVPTMNRIQSAFTDHPGKQVTVSQQKVDATPAQKQQSPSSQQQQQPSARPDDLSVVGSPSINVTKIAQVLSSYGSPLNAQSIYDYGLVYNIDPAFALAFFVHESGAGTKGAAVTHLNPGNLRSSPIEKTHDGFAYFENWDRGISAWYLLISSELYVKGGLTTVYPIVAKYAPTADNNDPEGYAAAVINAVKGWRS